MRSDFTDQTRRALARARDEAIRLRHDYIGTEHILLGLIGAEGCVAAGILRDLGADPGELRRLIEKNVTRGKRGTRTHSVAYTTRARKALQEAVIEARQFSDAHIGTEHVLVGLLRDERGLAAKTLKELGIDLEGVRARMRPGTGPPARAPAAPAILRIAIDDEASATIYEQIVAQVKEAVATGQLRPRDRLPAVRALADELDIAPGTVARAYRELERQGVVVTDGARGTFVAEGERGSIPETERAHTLAGLLRPVAVAAYHLGAGADELRQALERAMASVFGEGGAANGDGNTAPA